MRLSFGFVSGFSFCLRNDLYSSVVKSARVNRSRTCNLCLALLPLHLSFSEYIPTFDHQR